MIKLICTKNKEEMGRYVADRIERLIKRKPDAVLGLPTGTTPIVVYNELASRFGAGRLDFSRVKTFNLDEYCGIDENDTDSYRHFMMEHLFSKVNIRPENIHFPDADAIDLEKECARYDGAIAAAGGLDLLLLGIGHNGHIGFNEPQSEFVVGTHKVRLSDSTIAANARLFASPSDVPRRAVTMGIGSMMNAAKIIVMSSGADKSEILYQAFHGSVKPGLPASILQLHDHCTVVGDPDAMRCFRESGMPVEYVENENCFGGE